MIRRRFLKGFLMFFGACAFSILDEFKAVKVLLAGQVPAGTGVQPKLPITLAKQAIQTNDPKEVVKFIISQPRQAENASTEDKLQLLKLVVQPCGKPGDTSIEQKNREQAAYIILNKEEGNPAKLAQFANGIGRAWIEKNFRAWKNTDLQRIVVKAISK
jgi:hypothetical protein